MIDKQPAKENYVQIMFDSVFDQVQSVLEIADRIPTDNAHRKWNPAAKEDRRAAWIGRHFKSWIDAQESANREWGEGIRAFDNAMNQLRDEKVPEPKSLKRKAYWSEDDGDEICLDRLRHGQPFMRHTKRQHRPGPISVTIITNITTHSGHISLDIIWRGVAAICLTEILEKAGYRVELWAANHCGAAYANSKYQLSAVRLKHGADPIDISTLINATSGWYYRTFFFGSYWLYHSTPTDGLGYCMSLDGIRHMITPDEQCMICDGVWSHSQAITWVRKQLESLK